MKPDEVTFIVGGASGIGLAVARLLVSAGRAVVIGDVSDRALHDATRTLKLPESAAIHIDVSDPQSVDTAFDLVDAHGPLRALVNSAGILSLGTILDAEEDHWRRIIDVNLNGMYRTCRAAIARMVTNDGGAIVNMTSQSGRTSSFYSSPGYVASKAGVIGLTMAIAAQHAHDGIRANAVAPGLVETPMIADTYTPEQRKHMTERTPIGRFAHAEELAESVTFLLDDRSSYITGQTLNVNGGSFMV